MPDIQVVQIENPDSLNVIIGQSHFIKTVEDIHETLVQSMPGIEFGISFCEASGPCLIRTTGNQEKLIDLSKQNAWKISCGHVFILFIDHAYPINILNAIKMIPEVCHIFCATANPLQLLIAETELGRGVLGVIDGFKPVGFESVEDKQNRHDMLRKFGYKL
ncbi:adenosine-specific kinase [bacterium]|nr:adenosine-specific kinase [bacterium]